MSSSLRGVVFDFGNVLYRVDYPGMAAHLAGERAPALAEAFVGSRAQIDHETGRIGLGGVLEALAARGFAFERDRFLEAYLSIFSPVPGVRRLLERLAGSVPLGLLSNTSVEHARLFIEEVPEIRYFSARAYSFEVGLMKPSPKLYLEISTRLGAEPEDLAFVDDLEANVQGAQAVGMKGILFRGADLLEHRLRELGLLGGPVAWTARGLDPSRPGAPAALRRPRARTGPGGDPGQPLGALEDLPTG